MAKVAILPWDIRAAHVPAAGNSIVNNIYKNGSYVILNPTWHAEDSAWKADNICNILKKTTFIFIVLQK